MFEQAPRLRTTWHLPDPDPIGDVEAFRRRGHREIDRMHGHNVHQDLAPCARFNDPDDRAVLWLKCVPGSYARLQNGSHLGPRLDADQLQLALDERDIYGCRIYHDAVVCYADIPTESIPLDGRNLTPAEVLSRAAV